jgi:hypothetical protein
MKILARKLSDFGPALLPLSHHAISCKQLTIADLQSRFSAIGHIAPFAPLTPTRPLRSH